MTSAIFTTATAQGCSMHQQRHWKQTRHRKRESEALVLFKEEELKERGYFLTLLKRHRCDGRERVQTQNLS